MAYIVNLRGRSFGLQARFIAGYWKGLRGEDRLPGGPLYRIGRYRSISYGLT
jgi:hypothetical protein